MQAGRISGYNFEDPPLFHKNTILKSPNTYLLKLLYVLVALFLLAALALQFYRVRDDSPRRSRPAFP